MSGKFLQDRTPTVPAAAVAVTERRFDQSTLASLRAELYRHGAANGLADVALAHFVLAINEITTNAVRYAGGHGWVCLSRHADHLWCVVTDHGPGIERRHLEQSQRRNRDQIGGQGIWLARHISDLTIETGRSSGTRIVLRFALPTAGSAT